MIHCDYILHITDMMVTWVMNTIIIIIIMQEGARNTITAGAWMASPGRTANTWAVTSCPLPCRTTWSGRSKCSDLFLRPGAPTNLLDSGGSVTLNTEGKDDVLVIVYLLRLHSSLLSYTTPSFNVFFLVLVWMFVLFAFFYLLLFYAPAILLLLSSTS